MDRKKLVLLIGALLIAIGTAFAARTLFVGDAAPPAVAAAAAAAAASAEDDTAVAVVSVFISRNCLSIFKELK